MAGRPREPLSISNTHRQVSVHVHAHLCTSMHAGAHTHADSHTQCTATHTQLHAVPALVRSRDHARSPAALHVPIPTRGEAREAHRPRGPSPWARLGQMPIFKGRADGPTALLPQRPRPSTSAEGPGQQLCCQHHPGCAQRQPLPPETLHDVTRPDRRKEQAPRSCKMQKRFPAWARWPSSVAAPDPERLNPGPA